MSIRLWLVKRQIRKLFRPKRLMNADVETIGSHFRETLTALEPKFPKPPKSTLIETVEEEGVRGDWVSVPGAHADRILFYIHGGGYVWGSAAAYHEFGYQLSKACKARVFLLDYGLAPEVQAPTQLHQSLAAYDYIKATHPSASVMIGGDSAGGGLAHATVIAIRDSKREAPLAEALIAPWVDITGSSPSIEENLWNETMLDGRALQRGGDYYRGELDPKDPVCSPLFAEQHDLPPVLMQVGQDEILRDDSVRLAAKIKGAGGTATLHVWPKVYHVWHRAASMVPEARRAVRDIADFFAPYWH